MSSKTFTTLLLALLIPFYSSCQTGQIISQSKKPSLTTQSERPDWISGKGHSDFPQNLYLVGVGVSNKNSVSANDSARLNLAKNLKVKIHSKLIDVSTNEKSYVESFLKTEVDTVLEGVEIKDGWHDQNKEIYYSLAVVEKRLVVANIQSKIKTISLDLERVMKGGVKSETNHKIIKALTYYFSGYQQSLTLNPLKNTLEILNHSFVIPTIQEVNVRDFEMKIKSIVHNLSIVASSGEDQTIKIQGGLNHPLIGKVVLVEKDKSIPVSSIPVVFSYVSGNGELDKNDLSGIDGIVQTRVHKVSSFDESKHSVRLSFDYPKIRSNFTGEHIDQLLLPLKNKYKDFTYTINIPQLISRTSKTWKDGMTELSNQLIRNIPPGMNPTLGVLVFRDLRINQITPFSRIFMEDIKNILAQADNLNVKEVKFTKENSADEIAKQYGLNYYITGSYRMEQGGLDIRSSLIETGTNNLHSSANTLIRREDLNPNDLLLLEATADEFNHIQSNRKYQESLEKLINLKPNKSSFNIKVWTDKNEYEIDQEIVFNIKSDKSGYLTLLDISPNGNITVIFPNKYHEDNFIRQEVTYKVPTPSYGFDFKVQGPTGLERIKAIVTSNSSPLLHLDLTKGFHTIKKGTTIGSNEIHSLVKKLNNMDVSKWDQFYSEIFIFNRGDSYKRGSRSILSSK